MHEVGSASIPVWNKSHCRLKKGGTEEVDSTWIENWHSCEWQLRCGCRWNQIFGSSKNNPSHVCTSDSEGLPSNKPHKIWNRTFEKRRGLSDHFSVRKFRTQLNGACSIGRIDTHTRMKQCIWQRRLVTITPPIQCHFVCVCQLHHCHQILIYIHGPPSSPLTFRVLFPPSHTSFRFPLFCYINRNDFLNLRQYELGCTPTWYNDLNTVPLGNKIVVNDPHLLHLSLCRDEPPCSVYCIRASGAPFHFLQVLQDYAELFSRWLRAVAIPPVSCGTCAPPSNDFNSSRILSTSSTHFLTSSVIARHALHRRIITPRMLDTVLVTVIIDVITAGSAMVQME